MTNNVTQFDLSSFAASAPSICIPRVFPNITERRVWAIFENLGFGEVEKIDMIERTSKSGDTFKRVFVHVVTAFLPTDHSLNVANLRFVLRNDAVHCQDVYIFSPVIYEFRIQARALFRI